MASISSRSAARSARRASSSARIAPSICPGSLPSARSAAEASRSPSETARSRLQACLRVLQPGVGVLQFGLKPPRAEIRPALGLSHPLVQFGVGIPLGLKLRLQLCRLALTGPRAAARADPAVDPFQRRREAAFDLGDVDHQGPVDARPRRAAGAPANRPSQSGRHHSSGIARDATPDRPALPRRRRPAITPRDAAT